MAQMVYITELDSGVRVGLPLTPESVKYKSEGKFASYNIIGTGEVRLPDGEKLTKFSWKGRLPGESMRNMKIVNSQEWRSANEIQRIFENWRKKGKKLRLLVTGTIINHDVYLESYQSDASKKDTIEYSISFVVAKDIIVHTTTELNIANTTKKDDTATTKPRTASAQAATSAKAKKQTYTVKRGDTLWGIAKKFLGNGSRWKEIYNLNKSIIGSNPNLIYVGQKFTIP